MPKEQQMELNNNLNIYEPICSHSDCKNIGKYKHKDNKYTKYYCIIHKSKTMAFAPVHKCDNKSCKLLATKYITDFYNDCQINIYYCDNHAPPYAFACGKRKTNTLI